jgi:NiFe hydrogenase small subunit HydA
MMMKTLYWLQCSACGGDTMSLLDIESPDLVELLGMLDIEVLWHPSLSAGSAKVHDELLRAIIEGEQPLTFLCVEGAVIRGPSGTGMYDTFLGRPKKDLVSALARRARYVIACGTCASFGGVGADGEIEATGLQYLHDVSGGFLGSSFRSGAGLPVINLPGCPCHGDVIASVLTSACMDRPIPFNEYGSPLDWYGVLVHQGCVRNEYHEYRIEERDFGERGCLFFYRGCRGPLAHGACNKVLWNRRSSKTRVGVPCLGCTEPDFPRPNPFFSTPAIVDVPIDLPNGVDRAHYLAYKSMAAAAAPDRLKKRLTRV